jgi:hypothetical protein
VVDRFSGGPLTARTQDFAKAARGAAFGVSPGPFLSEMIKKEEERWI